MLRRAPTSFSLPPRYHKGRMRSFRGLSLVDVIVGVALVTVIFVGLFGILRASVQVSGLAKLKAAATSVAVAQMEYLRSLPYASVGTVSGIPAGVVPQYASSTNGGLVFDVRTYIEYADDAADGSGASDTNGITADYKRAKVIVSYRVDSITRDVTLVTSIAPKGIESTAGGGTLLVSTVDAVGAAVPGATVHIQNSATVPTIDFSTFSDAYGLVNLPGAPTSTEYRITVSKTGYSSAMTYARDATNANPTPGYLTVVEGATTAGTFAIDWLGTLVIRTFSPIAPDSWNDTFADASGLYSLTNATASGGALTLTGAPGTYPGNGSALSTTTAPAYLSAWTSASASVVAPAGTMALFSVADASGVLLPDAALPGNAAGFSGTADLSSLSTSTYPSLRLLGLLTSTDPNVAPGILDWTLSYEAGPTPLPNVSLTLTGAKTTGSMTDGTPLYKTTVATTTNASGVRTLFLEWDSYNISIPGYTVDAEEPAAPYDLLPNTTVDASLILSP